MPHRIVVIMMEKKDSPIYDRNTLEFVTVALEYCNLVETTHRSSFFVFLDKAIKIIPLLYVKATLLPQTASRDEQIEPASTVTEEMYELVRNQVASLLGEHDTYLDTFHQDMQYSDAPIAAFISENLADVYQDVGNFVSLFRQGREEVMSEAVALCQNNFADYWGQQLLNALKALHSIRYNEEIAENIETTKQHDTLY